MKSFSFNLPDELIETINKHPEIDWDSLIKHTIEDYLRKVEMADKLVENSKFTEEDAIEIGRMVNQSAFKKFLEETL